MLTHASLSCAPLQSATWNRSIGSQHDNINCFHAGMEKATKAVTISKLLGNTKGKKYAGPSAEALCKSGADAMRTVRLDNKNRTKENELAMIRARHA